MADCAWYGRLASRPYVRPFGEEPPQTSGLCAERSSTILDEMKSLDEESAKILKAIKGML